MSAGLEGVNRTLFLGTSPTRRQHLTRIISLRFYLILALNCPKVVDLQRMSLINVVRVQTCMPRAVGRSWRARLPL
jgi:hypothetical protein